MTFRFWTLLRHALFVIVWMTSAMSVQVGQADDHRKFNLLPQAPEKFSLLPPAPEAKPEPAIIEADQADPESQISTDAPESVAERSSPTAFQPPGPALPPAFTPPLASQLNAPRETVASQPRRSTENSMPDHNSGFGPPPMAAASNGGLATSPGVRIAQQVDDAAQLPPVTAEEPAVEPVPTLRGELVEELPRGNEQRPAATDDKEFYEQILTHPNETFSDDYNMLKEVAPLWDEPMMKPPNESATWWESHAKKRMTRAPDSRQISINSLIASALQHSAQIQVISDTPLIRDTAIIESDAAFDWSGFVETNWYDTNEPVGSTLTTGGPPRFENELFEYEYGLRKKTAHGGRLEIGQRYGHERSNSIFFIPNDQGTSRLTLSYSQPLLRGGGRVYNTSLVLLAQVESGAARNEFSRELQDHLLEVTRAYWALYLERGALIQKERLYLRGQEILKDLEHRQVIDAVMNQIVRARAAVTARQSDLYRSAAAVKNAEGRIRALVNAPDLGILDEYELIPQERPTPYEVPVDLRGSLETSLRERPEVHSAIKQIKASSIRRKMSKNELLPALDVVLETYVAGLRGESNVGVAWREMFTEGAPSYSAGLQLEIPLRNREARSRYQRRALEMRQFQNQFRATLYALQLEVEIAVREVQASYREMVAKRDAMEAAASEVDYIERRWRLLPGEDRTASLVLEDLLGAQERLTAEEFDFLNAQVTYNLSLTALKKATGTLLQMENVSIGRSEESGIPSLELYKGNVAGHQAAPVNPVQYEAPVR